MSFPKWLMNHFHKDLKLNVGYQCMSYCLDALRSYIQFLTLTLYNKDFFFQFSIEDFLSFKSEPWLRH